MEKKFGAGVRLYHYFEQYPEAQLSVEDISGFLGIEPRTVVRLISDHQRYGIFARVQRGCRGRKAMYGRGPTPEAIWEVSSGDITRKPRGPRPPKKNRAPRCRKDAGKTLQNIWFSTSPSSSDP